MTYKDALSKIRRVDTLLSSFEDNTIARVKSSLYQNFDSLSRELRRNWDSNGELTGKSRAVLLLNSVNQYLSIISDKDDIEALMNALVMEAANKGVDLSAEAIAAIDESYNNSLITVDPNIEAVAFQVRDGSTRLKRHGEDFRLTASKVIESSLISGAGVAKTIDVLRSQLALTQHAAEVIVRTESMSSLDSATSQNYAANGIEYVQRVATQDSRICPTCAARAGNVYPIDKAPSSLHPQDRCYNLPWKKQWQDLGLIDVDSLKKSRESMMASLRDRGLSPNYGRSPFEVINGVSAPVAVWKLDDDR